jgi:hypothetical protein
MLDVMILKGTFLSCYIESQNGNEFSEIRHKLVLYFNVDLLKTFLSYKTRHAYKCNKMHITVSMNGQCLVSLVSFIMNFTNLYSFRIWCMKSFDVTSKSLKRKYAMFVRVRIYFSMFHKISHKNCFITLSEKKMEIKNNVINVHSLFVIGM